MSVDWLEIPPELFELIASKLGTYIDYLRFRAVCHKWRSSVAKTPNHLPCQLPWLMLPRGHQHPNRVFFSLTENKFNLLNLPESSYHKRRCGSSHGWLAIVDECPAFYLLNAITNTKFELPPLSSFPMVVDFDFSKIGREYTLRSSHGELYSRSLREIRDSFIEKLVLSSSPLRDDNFIALVILESDIAFCRKGDNCWSIINDAHSFSADVVYHDGLFYALNRIGHVAVCDLTGNSPRVWTIQSPLQIGGDVQYLVNCGEDIMCISRFVDIEFEVEPDPDVFIFKTTKFTVAKLNQNESKWENVTKLGDHALFLGENSSLCMKASEFPGCKQNCIYFTDDYSISNYEDAGRYYDVGIFSLINGSVEAMTAYPRNWRSHWPPPVWVTPNPC